MKTSPTNGHAGAARDEERWRAVVEKDRNADSEFFYSVKTTEVHCRPSCSARTPRRENVAFHESREAAEQAGFRPCKRCRPNGPGLAEQHTATVAAACRAMEGAEELPDLRALASSVGMSRFHFHRIFKAATGLTPRATPPPGDLPGCGRYCSNAARSPRRSTKRGLCLTAASMLAPRTSSG